MEETNKNEKLILFLKIIAIIFIGGFSCLLIGSFAFISIVNAQEVIESDNLIIQKMNGNTLVGNYETSSDVNGYSFYNMSNSISATTSDIKILTKSAINTSGNVAIYTFALYPNNNTENIVRNVQVLGNSCSFETKKISDTTSDHYFVVNVVCPVESVNLGTNWVVSQVKLSNAQLRGVGIGDITFTNTNQDVLNILNGMSGNVTNLLSKLTAIDNNIYNIINRQDAIVTTIINATSTITNAINNQNSQQHQDAQAQKEATDNINDSINDSSTDDPTSDLEDMEENEISNSVISDLLLLPLNMFQRIINSINGTCSTFNLGSLYGSNLTLPCIDIPSVIGSSLWGVIDILFSGIFVLTIRKKFVDIFENITSLKDRGNELE